MNGSVIATLSMSVWDKVKKRLGTDGRGRTNDGLDPEAAFAEDHYTRYAVNCVLKYLVI